MKYTATTWILFLIILIVAIVVVVFLELSAQRLYAGDGNIWHLYSAALLQVVTAFLVVLCFISIFL